jgi:putative ABC transport system substrate-binding protein
MCSNGGLATVSISYYDIGYLCGEQAYDILVNGADVSTMPIAYSTNPVKEYNADYASAIGFTMPDGFDPIG